VGRLKKQTEKPPLPMVCLLAFDWSGVDNQVAIHQAQKFGLMDCWIMGFIVHEDEEKITLARDHFYNDEEVRATITVSQETIKQRIDFSL